MFDFGIYSVLQETSSQHWGEGWPRCNVGDAIHFFSSASLRPRLTRDSSPTPRFTTPAVSASPCCPSFPTARLNRLRYTPSRLPPTDRPVLLTDARDSAAGPAALPPRNSFDVLQTAPSDPLAGSVARLADGSGLPSGFGGGKCAAMFWQRACVFESVCGGSAFSTCSFSISSASPCFKCWRAGVAVDSSVPDGSSPSLVGS